MRRRVLNMDEGQSPKDKFLYIVSLLTIVSALFLGGLLLYWTLEPDQVYSVKDHNIAVLNENKTVRVGEDVSLKFSFCKKIETNGVVQRNFYNRTTVITGPEIPEEVGKTCVDDVVIDVPLPNQIEPGTYRVQYIGKYQINPIKNVTETFYSEEFTVVK